jgi:phosphatidylserine decarboxylase
MTSTTWLQSLRSLPARLGAQEDLNFLLTNRIPRNLSTRLVGKLSRVRQPLVRDACMALWRGFAELDLSDAEQAHFASVHDCFTRRLKPGARPIDTDPTFVTSPCDAIVGANGRIDRGTLLQAKGFGYSVQELLLDAELADRYRHGSYATLRLTSTMYHRFHAPYDCRIERVTYISGDTWNVNPIALQRIEKLFCKNERVVIECRLPSVAQPLLLVPIAAILVASIRLHFANVLLHLRYRGPNVIPCDAVVNKGDELGWFEHGSTIVVLAPPQLQLCPRIVPGQRIRVGQPLLSLTDVSGTLP